MRARLYHPIFGRLPRQSGLLLASATGGGGGGGSGFSIPTPPASSTSSVTPYVPNFTAGPTGLDPFRPWSVAVLDGISFVANGWDTPKRWDDGSNFFLMGSVKPTSFAVADAAGGTSHTAGDLLRYYLVFAVSGIDKETAPQVVNHTMAGTKDTTITWTAGEATGDQDKVRIYRALVGTGTKHLVAEVAASAGTYTDATTDATLATNALYVQTSRETLPPVFFCLAPYLGRLWGTERNGTTAYYGQQVSPASRFRGDDFPAANLMPIGPNDGLGGVRAIVSNYSSLYFFKRLGGYEMTGSDASTFAMRPLNNGRGCLGPRCFVSVNSRVLVFDELGGYYLTPAGTVLVAGAGGGTRDPMRDFWPRLNLGAMDLFHVVHLPRRGIVAIVVAVDEEPVPNVAVLYDYVAERYIGIRTAAWATASGLYEDAGGTQHEVFGCDLGFLWEDGYAHSQGVFAGSNTGAVTSASSRVVTCSAAAFGTSTLTSPQGTPMDRYEADGDVVDENRVYSNTATALTTLYFPTASHVASDTVAVGVIPFIVETPDIALAGKDKTWLRKLIVDHDIATAGSLRVDVRSDDDAYTNCRELLLTQESPRLRIVKPGGAGKGWTVSVRLSMRYANYDCTVRSLSFHYDAVPGVRS